MVVGVDSSAIADQSEVGRPAEVATVQLFNSIFLLPTCGRCALIVATLHRTTGPELTPRLHCKDNCMIIGQTTASDVLPQ